MFDRGKEMRGVDSYLPTWACKAGGSLSKIFRGWNGAGVSCVIFLALLCVCLPVVFSRGISVSFDIQAERDFVCSVYYQECGNSQWKHVDTGVRVGKSNVRMVIPADGFGRFRIDFGAAPGRVNAGPVHLSGSSVSVLKWNDFTVFNDVSSHVVSPDGRLTVTSNGRDPYAVYGKAIDVRSGLHLEWRRAALCGLILLVALFVLFWKRGFAVASRGFIVRSLIEPASSAVWSWWCNGVSSVKSMLPSRSFAIYMLTVVVLAWGFELFNFTLTSDDDVVLYGGFANEKWLLEGRWGMYVIGRMLGNNSVPVFPLAITLALYALSFNLVFCRLGKVKYFLFPVYVAFPVVYQSFSFSSLNPGVGVAFFATALAAGIFDRKVLGWCSAVFLGAVSIGCYQIFVFLMAIIVVVRLVDRIYFDDRFNLRDYAMFAMRGCLMVVCAYLLYKITQLGFQRVTGVVESYVTNRYLAPPANWSEWRAWATLAAKHVHSLLSGGVNVFPSEMLTYTVLVRAAFCTVVAWVLFSRRPVIVRLAVLVGCVSLFVLAFMPLAFNKRAVILDRIIILLVPTALVGLLSLSARFLENAKIGKLVGVGLCLLCSFQFIWCMNQMAYSNFLQNRHDANFLAAVKSRVEVLPEAAFRRFNERPVPLLVVGRCEFDRRGSVSYARKSCVWPEWEHDNVGRSLLVEPGRWRFALKTCLGATYAAADAARITKETQRFVEGMPIWPLAGSVAWKDGYAIVKFSDFAPQPVAGARKLSRRLCHCRDVRINGFDELACSDVDPSSLLYRFGASDIISASAAIPKGSNMLFDSHVTKNASLSLKPHGRKASQYLILKMHVEVAKDCLLTLWGGDSRKECQFVLYGGANVLRLRVPPDFMVPPLLLNVSVADCMVKIADVSVYVDKVYTENLLKLNPGLKTCL